MIMENKVKYSIVVPCYNSEYFLDDLCIQVYDAFQKDFELIFVNDFSSDRTNEKIIELKDNYHFIKGFSFPANLGQIASTLFGISKAKGKIIITIDDDLQHNIQSYTVLETLLKNKNLDIVVATWKTDETLIRNTSSTIFRILSSLIILKKTDFRNTAFRIFKSENKNEIFDFFCSRFWFDPRRIIKPDKIGQTNVDHFLQFNRPQSSFRARVALASKHIFFDSYLINLTIMISVFFVPRYIFIFLSYYLLQKTIRYKTKRKRIKIFNEVIEL